MAVEEIILRSVFDDQISDEVDGVIDNLKKFDAAAGAAAETFKDELAARVQGAVDTIVEFGGSIEDVRAAQERLRKATGTGARGLAQQANVLRTLTDESEDSAAALKNLDKALELAAASGLKAEDAGRELGKALKGDVAVLNTLDARAQAAAKAIEGITDPAMRTKLIMQELDRALSRKNGTLAKLQNSYKALKVMQPGIASAFKGLAVSIGAAGGALTALGATSVKTYLEGSAKMRAATKANAKSLKEAKFAMGGIVLEAVGIREAFSKGTNMFSGLAKMIIKNRVPIAQTLRDVALIGIYAVQAIAKPFEGIAFIFAIIQDYFNEVIKGFSLLAEGALKAVIAISKVKKFAVGLTPLEQRNMQEFRETIAQLEATRLKTPFMGQTTKLADNFGKAHEFIDKIQKKLETKVTFFDIGAMTEDKPGKPKAAVDPDIGRKERLKAAQDEAAENARRARILKEQEIAKDRERFDRELEASQSAFDAFTKPIEQTRAALFALGVEGFGAVIDGAFNMVEALATGQLAIKDLGAAASSTVGSILFDQGQALAEAAIKQGAVFTLLGEAYAALATNPLALLGIGAALVGAGLALKAFAQPDKKRAASRGDTRAAAAIERLGRDLFQKQEQGREMILMVGDRQMRGYVVDTANDAARRGQLAPAR